ncbi:MAG TPA: ABC transporter permease [Candidatus Limnocylindrales bacterium]|jgi:ABC-2 type transport system permease protein
MNPLRVAAVFRRIVAQFRRDPRSLALLIVAPLAIIALLGWVLGSQQATAARVAVINNSTNLGSGAVVTRLQSALEGQTGITIDQSVVDDSTARQMLKDKKVDLVVVLPADFSLQNRKIDLLTLGLNPTAEAAALPAVQKALLSAVADSSVGAALPTIERATVYGSPNSTQLDSLAPVVVGFFAYFFVFILTGISFLRERIGGTLERLLATPVSRAEIVLGYSLGFGFFATLQVAIVLAFVLGRFGIPALGPVPAFAIGLGVHTAGNPLISYLLVLVLGLGAVSLGIFLSTFARSELQILQFIPIVIVPQGLLSGFFWPIEGLPNLLQPVARILPVTYAIDGLRQVMIAGADLSSPQVLLDLGVLTGIAAVFVILAAATIRREVA